MVTLSKWYFDCVTDRGDVFIGYWARFRWGFINLPFSAVILKPSGRTTEERTSIYSTPEPTTGSENVCWTCPRLGVTGTWARQFEPVNRILYESSKQTIGWSSIAPAARVSVTLDGNAPMTGYGCVESVSLRSSRWQLPFSELSWGRFVTEDDALAWIVWGGETPGQWVFVNGREARDAVIGENRIEVRSIQAVLDWNEDTVIRDGDLVDAIFGPFAFLGRLSPRSISGGHETKWFSRATLSRGNRTRVGWVIHEVVRWQ